jgi:hypothetical protein
MVMPVPGLAVLLTQEAKMFCITYLQPSQQCHSFQVCTYVPPVVIILYFSQQTLIAGVGLFHVDCMSKKY